MRKELWNLQLWLRKVFKAKCVLHAQRGLLQSCEDGLCIVFEKLKTGMEPAQEREVCTVNKRKELVICRVDRHET